MPNKSRIAALIFLFYSIINMIYWCTNPGIGASHDIDMAASVAVAILYSSLWLLFQFYRKTGWYLLVIMCLIALTISLSAENVVAALVHFGIVLLLILDRPSAWRNMPQRWQFPEDVVVALAGRTDDRARISIAWSLVIFVISMGLLIGWRHLYVEGKAPDLSGRYRIFDWDAGYFWSPDSRSVHYLNLTGLPTDGPIAIVRYSLDQKTRHTIKLQNPVYFQDGATSSPDGKSLVTISNDQIITVDLSFGVNTILRKHVDDFNNAFWLSDHEIGILGDGFAVYDLHTRTLTRRSRSTVNDTVVVAVDGTGFVEHNGNRVVYTNTKTGHQTNLWADKSHSLQKYGRVVSVTSRYFIAQQYNEDGDLCVVDLRSPHRPPMIIRDCPLMHSLSPDLKWYIYVDGGPGEWVDHALYVGKTPKRVRNSILGYTERIHIR